MRLILIVILMFLSACQSDQQTARTIDMFNSSGDMIGTAKLTEQPEGVKIKLKLEGLTPGFHGIHVHEYPKCEGPDFKSAGNHFNPEGKEHGLMHPDGAHLGDLPNIEADASGLIEAELVLANATLLDGKNSILKEEGTSLIISEKKDDGVSQPSGDSGIRMFCSEIQSKAKEDLKESPSDPSELNKKNEKQAE